MRYRYTFDVKSHTQLTATLSFTHNNLKFRLVENDGRFAKLIVETGSITMAPESIPTVKQGEAPNVLIPHDAFLVTVIEEVRAIRGALGLWGVFDIDVDQVLREFVPESFEENVEMEVKSIQFRQMDRDKLPMVPNVTELLVRCVLSRQKIAPIEVPLEFYRRGSEDRFRKQYAEAIFNFFFVLEYLFGEGQFKTSHLVKNFLASTELRKALDEARGQFLNAFWSEDVATRFSEKYGKPSHDKVVETIVALRGRLHHQTSKRTNWHPALQHEFEIDAHFLGAVCQSLLMKLVLEILFEDHAKKQFLATPVLDANDKPITFANPEQSDA